MNDEVWKEFAKDGWKHDEVPSKRDCFEAGWNAAVAQYSLQSLEKEMERRINQRIFNRSKGEE